MRQIEKDYDVSRASVAKFLEKLNIKTQHGNHYRKYHHNENFFEVIDNEKKAYWLGFMYADGWILDNTKRYGQDHFGIGLDLEDEQHLIKFLQDIEANNPLHYDVSKDRHMVKVELTSQKTVDDLINQGCFKQKTAILQPPKNVPENLLHHFIRGFFDGDGSIVESKGQYYQKTGLYKYSINFSCVECIGEWLKEYFGFGSVVQDKRKSFSYSFTIGGDNCVEKFYNVVYKDATIYLDRKYKRFQNFLKQKYGENRGT